MSAKKSGLVKTYLTQMKTPVGRPMNNGELLGDLVESFPFFRLFLVGCSEGKESIDGGFVGVFVGDAGLKLMLSHDQTCRRAYVTAQNWVEALTLADRGLESGKLDWRHHKPKQSPKGAKKAGL